MTADNIREAYRANCFRQSALNLVERTVKGLLGEMGRKTSDCAHTPAIHFSFWFGMEPAGKRVQSMFIVFVLERFLGLPGSS